jgi:hypothetical protein
MRRIKTLSIIFIAIIMATSCTKKIHTNEVSFKSDSVYYDNRPFTGEIWTEDDKTGCFDTDKGVLKSLKFYHENGKEAISMEIKNNGKAETHVYDDKGNSTDIVSFQQKYMDLWIKIALIQGEFMSK